MSNFANQMVTLLAARDKVVAQRSPESRRDALQSLTSIADQARVSAPNTEAVTLVGAIERTVSLTPIRT